MKYSVELVKNRKCRYVFSAGILSIANSTVFRDIDVLIDTGSFNTTIDSNVAKLFCTVFKESMRIKIGGEVGEANICIIHKMKINDCTLENILALSFPFKGELRGHILLGTNVMNNWEFIISRKHNSLQFNEDFPQDLPNLVSPYRNYFNSQGKYVYFQEAI